MPSDHFPPDPAGARAARRFARHALWDLGEVAEVAELLVSELATNAVQHASTPFTVEVVTGDPVLVVVSDGVRVNDLHITPHDADAAAGRGLVILDSLADRWGVEPTETGKRVWFELRAEHVF